MPVLPYDILLDFIPFLDPFTLVTYATVYRPLCEPALRHLWRCPRFSNPDQLGRFIPCLDQSTQSYPYHQWITSIIITFATFQPIPLYPIFQSLVQDLVNLKSLSLSQTYAMFSPRVQHYAMEHCMLEIPIYASSNNQATAWINHYFKNRPDPLPLTHLSITHTSVTGMLLTDDHLLAIAHCCPRLQQIHLSGLFSDQGIITLATYCPDLQDLTLSLPTSLVQSNTITNAAIHALAISCPRLVRLACPGQIRIDAHLAKKTLQCHCKQFAYADFRIGLDE